MHQTPQTRHDAAGDHAALLIDPLSQLSSADAADSDDTAGVGGDRAGEAGGDTLDDAARDEKEYVRGRLRGELGREPSEEELSEWLRQHTEGY